MKNVLSQARENYLNVALREKEFKWQFDPHIKIGLPLPWTLEGLLYSYEVYEEEFNRKKREILDTVPNFPSLDGKTMRENFIP